MNINLGKITQITLILLSFILLFYTYYYLPKQNKGSIKVETKEEIKTVEEINQKIHSKILSISIRIRKGKNTQPKRKNLTYYKTSQT